MRKLINLNGFALFFIEDKNLNASLIAEYAVLEKQDYLLKPSIKE